MFGQTSDRKRCDIKIDEKGEGLHSRLRVGGAEQMVNDRCYESQLSSLSNDEKMRGLGEESQEGEDARRRK